MKLEDLIVQLQAGHISPDEFQTLARPLMATADLPPLTCKVGPKRGCSVYGMNGPFPTTLYPNQWRRLFENTELILAFLTEHESEFSVKK
jgi:hypothetical protein